MRPDIRACVIENTHVLLDLMSRDEEAYTAFSELVGGFDTQTEEPERWLAVAAAFVVLVGGCAAAGAGVGYLSRP